MKNHKYTIHTYGTNMKLMNSVDGKHNKVYTNIYFFSMVFFRGIDFQSSN